MDISPRYHAGLRRHPLALFLVLTFAISWGLWFAAWPLYGVWYHGAALVATLGLFGPLFSALVVAAITRGESDEVPWSEIWKTLGPVLLAMAAAAVLGYAHVELVAADVYVAVMVVGAASYLLYRLISRPGDLNLGAREGMVSKGHWVWLVAALALPPLLMALSIFIQTGAGADPVDLNRLRDGFWRLPLVFSAVLIAMGPLGEEPGWRGFALPLLLKRHNPLLASLVIGVVWAAWHLPVDLAGHDMAMLPEALWDRLTITLPVSLVMTWLYIRGGRSLLPALFMHASLNATWLYVLPSDPALTLSAAALLCVLGSRMWKKWTPD